MKKHLAITKSNKILSEGLQEGDLRNLVLPLISIDQYFAKSGSDDEVIVVAFFVSDSEAAQDFMRFVSKTSAEILDVETSPAPNPEGYWLVFVEMLRNKNTVNNIMTILDELASVTKIKKYKARVFKLGKNIDVNEQSLRKYLNLGNNNLSNNNSNNVNTDELKEWLGDASSKFKFLTNDLNECDLGKKYVTIYFGDIEHLPNPDEFMDCFGIQTNACYQLKKTLGSQFQTMDFGDVILVSKTNSNCVLLLKSA